MKGKVVFTLDMDDIGHNEKENQTFFRRKMFRGKITKSTTKYICFHLCLTLLKLVIKSTLFNKSNVEVYLKTMMVLVRSEWSGRTGSPKKGQKVTPPKQNIVIFLHSSTMTVPPQKR